MVLALTEYLLANSVLCRVNLASQLLGLHLKISMACSSVNRARDLQDLRDDFTECTGGANFDSSSSKDSSRGSKSVLSIASHLLIGTHFAIWEYNSHGILEL
jgi:hypothetical protein